MKFKLSPRVISKNLHLIILLVCLLAAVWTLAYVYLRVYKAIAQTEDIVVLRSDLSLQRVKTDTFKSIDARREKIRALKPLDISSQLNPFLETTK